MRKFTDLTGKKFNSLTVISNAPSHKKPSGHICKMWLCRCNCGTEKVIRGDSLKNGTTRSCGCEHEARRIASCTKHGLSLHPMYSKWEAMKARCYTQNSICFKFYGARGIRVDEPWKSDFASFYADMLIGWSPGMSLERKNPEKNYNKENCIWIPLKDQWDNSRRTVFVRVNGEITTLKKASIALGIPYWTAHYRFRKNRVPQKEAREEIEQMG